MPADVPTTGPNTKPGEKPPVMPVAATRHTTDGAKAFAEFFVRTIDWGYATVSSAYMRRYFDKGCVQCGNVANSMDRTARAKHRYVGGRLTSAPTTSATPTGTPAAPPSPWP